MFLSVQDKPEISFLHKDSILEISDAISNELAIKLRSYALGPDSGLHRRGSKTRGIKASFFTCLVPNHHVELYDTLDPIWKQYINLVHANVTFIEMYELKVYSIDDRFDWHHDNRDNLEHNISRKHNFIIQLSNDSDYDGGDLIIGEYTCPRQFGTAILFPAYFMHCVTPITRGTRISLIGHAWGPLY